MRATWRQLIGWSAGWWRGGCLPPLAARRTPHRTTVAAGGRSLPSAVAERLGLRVATPYHSGPQIDPRNRPISLFQPHILIELRTFRSRVAAWGRRENKAGSGCEQEGRKDGGALGTKTTGVCARARARFSAWHIISPPLRLSSLDADQKRWSCRGNSCNSNFSKYKEWGDKLYGS